MSRDSIKVRGNEVVKAIREEADDLVLMHRYGLTQTELEQLFKKLVDAKLIEESELVARRAWLAAEPIIEIEPDQNRASIPVSPGPEVKYERARTDAGTERRTGLGIVVLTAISSTVFGIFFLIWLFKILGSISAGGQSRFLYLEYNFGGDAILCVFFGMLAVLPPVLVYLRSQDYHASRDAGEAETFAREQRIFWYGFLGTVGIGVAGAYLLTLVAPYQEEEIRVIVTALAKLSWMYFVGRLSWALKQPIILTIVWCLLSLFGILWIISLVGILISLHLAKRRFRESAPTPSTTPQPSGDRDKVYLGFVIVALVVVALVAGAILLPGSEGPRSQTQTQPAFSPTGTRSQSVPRPPSFPVAESLPQLIPAGASGTRLMNAVRSGDIEGASDALAKHSGLVDAFNEKCETPLIIACRRGHVEMVKLLLKEGADPLFIPPGHCGQKTALQVAKKARNREIVHLLEEAWEQQKSRD